MADAFELRRDLEDLDGASVSDPRDGKTLDIKELLAEGDGQIVTKDPVLAEVFRYHDALVPAKPREAKQKSEPAPAHAASATKKA